MKKLIPVATFAILALVFASCKKDYTCTCVVTPTGSTTGVSNAYPENNTTLDKAKSDCSALQAKYTTSTTTASCNL